MTNVDSKNGMKTSIIKWNHILAYVMVNGNSKHCHNGTTPKDKCGSFYGDYKKIIDYMNNSNHNEN